MYYIFKMINEIEYLDDDWTSVIDDIDKFQLSDNATRLIPLSKLHRQEQVQTEAMQEEFTLVI